MMFCLKRICELFVNTCSWSDTNRAVHPPKIARVGLESKGVAKTDALISYALAAQLVCSFDFAYAKSRFSYDAAQMKTLFV